jgi:RNA polymerase-binding transcription factor DksA
MAKKKTTTARKVARKKTTTKARPKKAAAKRTPGRSKPAAKKAARKVTTRKRPAAKATSKKATKKATSKKAAATKATRKKVSRAKKATERAPARKATTRKTAARKAPAKRTAAKKVAPKKTVTKKPTAKKATAAKVNSAKRANSRAKVVEEIFEEPPKPLKSPYTKTQLRPMRKALIRLRQRILFDLGMLSNEALRASDPDVDSDSVADHGSDAYERNLTLGLMEHDSKRIREIDDAMAIMAAGSYGACQLCTNPIPLARLEALPFACTCVSCQEKEERRF